MKKKESKSRKLPINLKNTKAELPGYPVYPPEEDIYRKYKNERDINPENKIKEQAEKTGKLNEKEFDEDMSGRDLDVPGTELDDEQEEIGSEDEENNYYSLGGDNHEDLEEDHGNLPHELE